MTFDWQTFVALTTVIILAVGASTTYLKLYIDKRVAESNTCTATSIGEIKSELDKRLPSPCVLAPVCELKMSSLDAKFNEVTSVRDRMDKMWERLDKVATRQARVIQVLVDKGILGGIEFQELRQDAFPRRTDGS